MPSLATITRAWEVLGENQLRETFPHLACFGIGWGEPFCFRCGWLAPSKEAADYPNVWPAGRAIDSAWQGSRGWLERCHLRDHYFGGTAAPLNLVPLCVLCHEEQPPCETRAAGIAFVNSASPRDGIAPWMQMITDELGRGIKRPGRERAERCCERKRHLPWPKIRRSKKLRCAESRPPRTQSAPDRIRTCDLRFRRRAT
jgi:hypothetical protein